MWRTAERPQGAAADLTGVTAEVLRLQSRTQAGTDRDYTTGKPALSLSRGLERDRGVDETGGQVAVFGRRGSRPLNLQEMSKLYLDDNGKPWYVTDQTEQRVTRE